MKLNRLAFFIFVLLILTTSGVVNAGEFEPHPRAGVCFRKPPETEAELRFDGHQAVYLYCYNCNVLPILVRIECRTTEEYARNIAALPLKISKVQRFSIFGDEPIKWHFVATTPSEVACVWIYAEWGRDWSKQWDTLE